MIWRPSDLSVPISRVSVTQISDDLDRDIVISAMGNVYFDLTQELNEQGPIRCDFVTRPPRVGRNEVSALFTPRAEPTLVVGIEPLIRMKRTQRAKDYPVIGELARLLPGEREIELTTDPDRILALAPSYGRGSARSPVKAALAGREREDVVVELARELDRMQQEDRARLDTYRKASELYMQEFQVANIADLDLPQAHERLCGLAEDRLPRDPLATGDLDHGNAERR